MICRVLWIQKNRDESKRIPFKHKEFFLPQKRNWKFVICLCELSKQRLKDMFDARELGKYLSNYYSHSL